jgi:hypothetical protein
MSYKIIAVLGTVALVAGAAVKFTPQSPALLAHDTWTGLPASITTTDGDTYDHVSLIRTEPDGYLVNYAPSPGAVGVAKIKFARLSPAMQSEAGYNPAQARNFEAQVASANQDLEQQRVTWQQADTANKQVQQARIDQEAQIIAERTESVAQMVQAQASLAQAAQNAESPGVRSSGAGFSVVGSSPNTQRYIDGFDPNTGFQGGTGTTIFGNLTPAHPAHK